MSQTGAFVVLHCLYIAPAQKFKPTILKTLKRKTTMIQNCPSRFIDKSTVLTKSRSCGRTVSDLRGRSTLQTKRKRKFSALDGNIEIQPVATTMKSSQFQALRK
jgi:hypothetical protein